MILKEKELLINIIANQYLESRGPKINRFLWNAFVDSYPYTIVNIFYLSNACIYVFDSEVISQKYMLIN